MIYNGKEIEFPAELHTSFFKVIQHLEELTKDSDHVIVAYAESLLAEVNKYPELRDGIQDISLLPKYQHIIKRLSRTLFPEVLTSNEIKILTPPFFFQPLRTSSRFDNIVKASGKPFDATMKGVDEDTFYRYCCYFILGSYYGYPVNAGNFQRMEIYNGQQKQNRSYKVLINADLCEFIPTERAKEISRQDYEELLNDFWNMDLWKEKFPPNSWIMKGITIVNLVDVTLDESINSIVSNLLVKSNDTVTKIRDGIRVLLEDAKLNIGLLSIDNQNLISVHKGEVTSIFLNNGETLACNQDLCSFSYEHIINRQEPLVITDAEVFHEQSQSTLSQKILAAEFQSFIIAPLVHEGVVQGFMEIGAYEKFKLHKGAIDILDNVFPILAMALKRFSDENQNRVEAIIQQECTTIHSSVKWRFEEEAQKFIHQQFEGGQPVFKTIVFKNLYPLYGQMDIKGSSERRNLAVSADLTKQIKGVIKVLKTAFKQMKLPIYEELLFQLETYKDDLSKELSAGSEHKLLTFLDSQVYPLFDHLAKVDNDLKNLIGQYNSLLDPELKTVYEKRKGYDLTVNQVNQRLASYLDQKQIEAQAMFPHYFERYKTDGVEFNMYIGQSITRDLPFNEIYLKNLRLWQLAIMCEMENEFKAMQSEYQTSIEIASLILVYNTPLSVHFRMDEKQFDVEGAYNARYEIIKKRIDKALIKGTNERITRPGSLAIIYSQDQDAQEYRSYLQFLSAKGYLREGYEDLELEDLQGIHGLRALRVDVAYADTIAVNKLIEEMAGVK